MRTSRALFAGFGTTSAMLAASACVFIVASALVAFNGWPVSNMIQSTGSFETPPVAEAPFVATGPTHVASVAGRAAATVAARPKGPVLVASRARVSGVGTTTGAVRRLGSHGHPSATTVSTGGTTTSATVPKKPTLSSVLDTGRTNAANAVTSLSDHLGTTVTTTGSRLGGSLQQTGDRLAQSVSKLSPTLASTVERTTTSLDKTLTGTTTLLGAIVTQAGETLGRALGGGGR